MAEEIQAATAAEAVPAAEAPVAEQTAPEAVQADPQAAPEKAPEPEAAEPKSEAPEDYGDFEDDKGVAFSSRDMPEFVAMARELGLSKDKAQKLLMTMVPTVKGKLQSSLEAVRTSWGRAARHDAEYGGESFKANLAIANKAYQKFTTPELSKLMRQSGLYAHPDFIRMFYRMGKAMQEDTGVRGEGTPQAKRSLFPNSNMG